MMEVVLDCRRYLTCLPRVGGSLSATTLVELSFYRRAADQFAELSGGWWTEQMDRAFEKLRAQRKVLIPADAKAGLLQAAASAYFEKADKGERGD